MIKSRTQKFAHYNYKGKNFYVGGHKSSPLMKKRLMFYYVIVSESLIFYSKKISSNGLQKITGSHFFIYVHNYLAHFTYDSLIHRASGTLSILATCTWYDALNCSDINCASLITIKLTQWHQLTPPPLCS